MQSTHHVNLRDPARQRLTHRGNDLLDSQLKRMRIAPICPESAKLAGKQADIGVVDVAVEDVGGGVPVLAFPNKIGHRSERVERAAPVKRQGIRIRYADPGSHFIVNGQESVGNKGAVHGF